MGRVRQPLLLLATFLTAFSALIEGRTTTFGQFRLHKIRPESEGFKGPYVDDPFNSVYHPDTGVRFRDKGSAKDGSTRVIGEEPALFLLHFLGFPFPFPFPFPLGFPFPFPFPLPLKGTGLWGGVPGGPGKLLSRRGGFPGNPRGYLAKERNSSP